MSTYHNGQRKGPFMEFREIPETISGILSQIRECETVLAEESHTQWKTGYWLQCEARLPKLYAAISEMQKRVEGTQPEDSHA